MLQEPCVSVKLGRQRPGRAEASCFISVSYMATGLWLTLEILKVFVAILVGCSPSSIFAGLCSLGLHLLSGSCGWRPRFDRLLLQLHGL